ncbi:hypothetical protein BCY84_09253 [Trypanosoma cruzi cruzi]|uniref:Uncharacterized protein n=1 Tax=Trypanosoma cruzi TaxID=5693 RepID=A0A2V2UW35_TRYCR|nr:hypothetical protein BCY84_22290 [Trypanosoma cruzi cruzi]PBJ76324.1 hypothetical protein BCY84_09253 [Trypanosoma cruzi cruzi]PWU88254.1 hypothetical protein C4B63_77g27 [Trypanosoma cruzi]
MDGIKGKPAMLMTRGIMEMRQNPPGLVCTIRRFKHPTTQKEVTLYPIVNFAAPHYFRRVLDGDILERNFDKVLCEDGRLPFEAGSRLARQQQMLKRIFPFFGLRPVTINGSKFDGIVQRDPVESRMAYQMIVDSADPPVDPRARRAMERIENYPDGTRVVCPWGVYHLVYMNHKLRQLGYIVEREEAVEVVGYREAALVFGILAVLTFWMSYAIFRMIFG